MNIFQAIILGVVQGATEFLPVSSSGHLVIFSQILGKSNESLVFFFVLLHVATLMAVVIYFWQDLIKVKGKHLMLLGLATIPAVFVGLFLKDKVEGLFVSIKLVGGAMLVTGVLNLLSDWRLRQASLIELSKKSQVKSSPVKLSTDDRKSTITQSSGDRLSSGPENHKFLKMLISILSGQHDGKSSFFPNVRQAFLIGVAQAVAITPGISRSGSTVAIGLIQGVKKETAFRFSFLLSIPAILSALILELLSIWKNDSALSIGWPELSGVVAAFLTGLLSLKLFSLVVAKNQMKWFGVYALILGFTVLIFA